MTDEELIARLREWDGIPAIRSAADRIEALVKERDYAQSILRNWQREVATEKARAERLEAALKMARAYVENMARTWEHAQQDLAHIDTALKENRHD